MPKAQHMILPRSDTRTFIMQGVVYPAIACLLFSLSFLPYFCDDSLISLRYVQNLLAGNGLIWTEGLPIEGYSNLAWLLLIALAGYFGADLIVATRVISALLMLSVLVTNYLYWRPYLTAKNRPTFLIAQYSFAFSATTGVWIVGGLEQPLLAAALGIALLCLTRYLKNGGAAKLLLASFCLGILCLTRPDSPLFCAAIALGIFIARGITQKTFMQCVALALFPVLFVVAQLVFRLYYYGEWVPNTAYIKVQPSIQTWGIGLVYICTGLLFMLPVSFYAFKAIGVSRQSPHRDLALIALCGISVSLLYLLFIGGDIFPAYRHFTLIIVLMTFILPNITLYFEHKKSAPSTQKIAVLSLIYIAVQWGNPATGFSRGADWVLEGKPISEMFKKGWGSKQPVIAVDAAGSLPYYTGYPAIDMLGLNDHHIARQQPDINTLYMGHQFGDGDYVYKQQPDMVNFCFPAGKEKPCWSGGKTLYQLPAFQRDYTPVAFQYTSDKTAIQWIKIDSPIIGIEKSTHSWLIPAYLLKSNEITTTYLNANQQFSIDIDDVKHIDIVTEKTIDRIMLIPQQPSISAAWDKLNKNTYRLTLRNQFPRPVSAIRVYFK